MMRPVWLDIQSIERKFALVQHKATHEAFPTTRRQSRCHNPTEDSGRKTLVSEDYAPWLPIRQNLLHSAWRKESEGSDSYKPDANA